MYAKQYAVFFNALLQAYCQDVTSQVINAFRTKVKTTLEKTTFQRRKISWTPESKLFSETFKAIATNLKREKPLCPTSKHEEGQRGFFYWCLLHNSLRSSFPSTN